MAAHATKADVEALERRFDAKLDATRDDLRGDIGALDRKLDATRDELRGEIAATRDELRGEIAATRDELRGEIRANGVVLEDVHAQMRGLAEAVTGLVGRENTRRIANVEKRLKRAR